MKCPSCGVDVDKKAVYCHKCGARLDMAPYNDAPPPAERFREAVAATRDSNDTDEEQLWKGGYATKAMTGAWIVSGLATLALVVLAIWSSMKWGWTPWVWWVVLALLVVLWTYQLIVLARRRLGVHYRLTTERFFHESGILRHTTDLIEVIDMDDVTYEQTLIDRLTGVGTIHVVSSDRSHPELTIAGIENVKEVAAMMHDARHTERLRRGLHIEQI